MLPVFIQQLMAEYMNSYRNQNDITLIIRPPERFRQDMMTFAIVFCTIRFVVFIFFDNRIVYLQIIHVFIYSLSETLVGLAYLESRYI